MPKKILILTTILVLLIPLQAFCTEKIVGMNPHKQRMGKVFQDVKTKTTCIDGKLFVVVIW